MKILVVTSECVPYAKTGGLGDAVGALAQKLALRGHDVRVILPRYYFIDPSSLSELHSPLGVRVGDHEYWCGVRTDAPSDSGPKYYFIDYQELYGRDGIYGTSYEPFFADNIRRFALLGGAAPALCEMLEWQPDILHCHDWPASPAILYLSLNSRPEIVAQTKSVFTIHNMGYQGEFELYDAQALGIPPGAGARLGIENAGQLNLLRGALTCADAITTVSPGYAEEIQTPQLGAGLDDVVRRRRGDLTGITNGTDYGTWNPEIDPYIPFRYTTTTLDRKEKNKRALAEEVGLRYSADTPFVGLVSRLAEQKGFRDLCGPESRTLHNICAHLGVTCLVLGTGDTWCEQELRRLDKELLNLRAFIAFDEGLAHRIEAGCDFFLMPSRYEPCGLNQLYSLRYGTVPIVTATGGLRDTVDDFDRQSDSGTGFHISGFGEREIYAAVNRAVSLFVTDRPAFRRLQQRGMARRFSWDLAAENYERVYNAAILRSSRCRR